MKQGGATRGGCAAPVSGLGAGVERGAETNCGGDPGSGRRGLRHPGQPAHVGCGGDDLRLAPTMPGAGLRVAEAEEAPSLFSPTNREGQSWFPSCRCVKSVAEHLLSDAQLPPPSHGRFFSWRSAERSRTTQELRCLGESHLGPGAGDGRQVDHQQSASRSRACGCRQNSGAIYSRSG